MNPKPLALLNHFTVPLIRVACILFLFFLLGPNSRCRDPNFQTTLGDCTRRLTSHARSEQGNGARGNSWGPSEVTGYLELYNNVTLLSKQYTCSMALRSQRKQRYASLLDGSYGA